MSSLTLCMHNELVGQNAKTISDVGFPATSIQPRPRQPPQQVNLCLQVQCKSQCGQQVYEALGWGYLACL